jgi:hypothetical protein
LLTGAGIADWGTSHSEAQSLLLTWAPGERHTPQSGILEVILPH